jgi:hypothetical protein
MGGEAGGLQQPFQTPPPAFSNKAGHCGLNSQGRPEMVTGLERGLRIVDTALTRNGPPFQMGRK